MLLTGIPTPRTWGVTTEFRLFQMRVNHFCSRVPLAGYLSWPSNVDSVERVILVEVLLVYRSVCITTCISFCSPLTLVDRAQNFSLQSCCPLSCHCLSKSLSQESAIYSLTVYDFWFQSTQR